MESKKRVDWIDFVKGIAILCVVWKHIKVETDCFGKVICAFHMPIFFILSGILLFMKNDIKNTGTKRFLLKKAASLLWPYLIFSLLSLAVLVVRHRFEFEQLIETCLLSGYSALWFLPCLFFSECICYFVLKKNHTSIFVIAIVGLLCISIYGQKVAPLIGIESGYVWIIFNSIIRTCTSSIFILIGYFGYEYLSSKHGNESKKAILIGVVLILGGIVFALLNMKSEEVSMRENILNNPILFYLSANMISWGIIISAKGSQIRKNVIHFFGKNSLIILVTHLPMSIVPIIKWKLPQFTGKYWINCLAVFIIIMIIESVFVYVINRWLKWLIKFPLKKECVK